MDNFVELSQKLPVIEKISKFGDQWIGLLSRTKAKLNWEDFVHYCTQLYTNLYGIDFLDIGRDNGHESGGNLSG